MRLWVRSGVQINLSFGFSRAVGSASGTANDKVLYQPINPVGRQSDFREKLFKRKDNASRSSHLHCRIPLSQRKLSTSWLENINPIPHTRHNLCVRKTPVFYDRLTHVQLLFSWGFQDRNGEGVHLNISCFCDCLFHPCFHFSRECMCVQKVVNPQGVLLSGLCVSLFHGVSREGCWRLER